MKTLEELKEEVQAKLVLKQKEEEAKKLKEQEYAESEEYKQKQHELEERRQKLTDEAVAKLMDKIQKGIDDVVSGNSNNKIIKFCNDNCKYPSSLSDVEDKLTEYGYIFEYNVWEGAEYSPSYSYIEIDLNQFFLKT